MCMHRVCWSVEMGTDPELISISLVSHRQGALIGKVLADLIAVWGTTSFEVILTKNVPEQFPFALEDFPYPHNTVRECLAEGLWRQP